MEECGDCDGELSEDQVFELLEPLRRVYGDKVDVDDEVAAFDYHNWHNDPNMYGSYSNWEPGSDLTDYFKFMAGFSTRVKSSSSLASTMDATTTTSGSFISPVQPPVANCGNWSGVRSLSPERGLATTY
jgi:hypothetical protein